jgi:hypothetical protein
MERKLAHLEDMLEGGVHVEVHISSPFLFPFSEQKNTPHVEWSGVPSLQTDERFHQQYDGTACLFREYITLLEYPCEVRAGMRRRS